MCAKKYFYMYEVGTRSGYNWFQVHVTNYYQILQPYVDRELISQSAIRKEKSLYIVALKPQLTYSYLYRYPQWDFETTGKNKILWDNFKGIPMFYFVMAFLPITGSWILLKYKVRDLLIKHGVWDKIKHNKVVRKFA